MRTWNASVADPPVAALPDLPAVLGEASSVRPLDAAATAFVASFAAGARGPVLWVQDRASRRAGGRLHEPGLRRAFRIEAPILHVRAGHSRDALRAMEEGASCAALGAVVGEVDGASPALDLTATKRLALRARESGVAVWLIRVGPEGGLSAARMRWRLAAAPSQVHPHDPDAPGVAVWTAELFRAAGRAPGMWSLVHEPGHDIGQGAGAPDRLRVVPRAGDGPLAAEGGPAALAG